MEPIFLALDSLFTRYVNLYTADNTFPLAHFNPPWPSSCIIEDEVPAQKNAVYWRPKERKHFTLFDDLENGFEFAFPDELKAYYGSFWANGICVEHPDLFFNLIQIWNEEDEAQLKENMLGHVFAKIKNKQPITFFIGCTDGNDIISLDKESGEIVIEKPGYKAHTKLSDSLEKLLLELTPNTEDY